jgi:hypothetical protein
LIETKWKDAAISKGLKYLKERFPDAEAYQISAYGEKDYLTTSGIRVMPAIVLPFYFYVKHYTSYLKFIKVF